MHVLVLNEYFPPDTSATTIAAEMPRAIASRWRAGARERVTALA